MPFLRKLLLEDVSVKIREYTKKEEDMETEDICRAEAKGMLGMTAKTSPRARVGEQVERTSNPE